MAYSKTTWVNGSPPALSAANLNKIENGISTNDTRLTTVENKLTDSGIKTTIQYVNYRKKNGIVFVDCYIPGNMTINTNYQVLGTLPAGYRPSGTFYGNAGTNSVNAGVFYISDTGNIGVKVFSGTTTFFWFQTSFAVTD